MLNDKVCRRSRWQHKFGLFCLMNTFFVNTNGRKLHTSMSFLSITIVRENQLNALCRHATEVHNRSLYRPCHTEYFHPLSKHCQLSASTSLAASLELFIICTIPTVHSSSYWLTSNIVFYHKQFLSDTTTLSPCFALTVSCRINRSFWNTDL